MSKPDNAYDLARSEARGHEERDISLRVILIGAVGISALIIVAAFGMRLLFDFYLAREIRRSPAANPLAVVQGKRLPPEPRLLPEPIEQLRQLRAEEAARLHSYGWVDRSQGIVQIPIERAMELVAEHGVRLEEETAAAGSKDNAE
jgi:hypothetical protein